ncbi:MAG: phosphorylase [Cyanobacteria bacterium P01_F01_bin.143]
MVGELSQNSEKLLLKPGTLWHQAIARTEFARQTGDLKSIETEYELIEQDKISFVIRSLSNITRKQKAQAEQKLQEAKIGKYIDPFLPYNENLFVCDLLSSHLCLLNKYNIVDGHLLIITRDFEEQENLLNIRDFVALWSCMREIDGLAFFNGGPAAGSSQRHKHLQLIPLPLVTDLDTLPIQAAIDQVEFDNSLGIVPTFPFLNAIASYDFTQIDNPFTVGKLMWDCYYALLEKVGFTLLENSEQQPGAYNLLATRKWMMIVPRSRDAFESIAINSLGFAGSLFVKNETCLKLLKEQSPLKILSTVAYPKE